MVNPPRIVLRSPPFTRWFDRANPDIQRRATAAITLIAADQFGDVKALGGGLFEARIFWGPGLRLYFTRRAGTIIVLLLGGTKATQKRDIVRARSILTTL